MKKLLFTPILLFLCAWSYGNDLESLSLGQIKMELTDLYFDMDDQLTEDHEINLETFIRGLAYLNELMNRGELTDKQMASLNYFEQRAEEFRNFKVNELIDFLELMSQFTLGMAKSR